MMRFAGCLLCVFLLYSCGGSLKLSNRNISHIYSQGINFIYPDYKAYNYSADSVRVFFKIEAGDLLFMKDDSSTSFRSSFAVSYNLLDGYESKTIADTGTVYFSYVQDEELSQDIIFNHFDVGCRDSSNYILEVTITDLNRRQAVVSLVDIDRTGIQSPENFVVYDSESNSPIIGNYTDKPSLLRLYYKGDHPGKIYLRYFRNDFGLSPPPFSDAEQKPLSYRADQTTLLDLSDQNEIMLDKPGIYHFQFDTMIMEGLTFFRFDDDFPLLTSADGLIESIRYLTTRQEYDKILTSTDKKQAVDNYWLSMAGNRERARILIKSYYSRVQFANRMFTSYLEGWKSDRGLIYIIFGPPATVYRSSDTETWSYSQNTFYGNLNFTFDHLKNPFTSNDYKLRRNTYYEIPWYRAVDSWRDGRVVNDSY